MITARFCPENWNNGMLLTEMRKTTEGADLGCG